MNIVLLAQITGTSAIFLLFCLKFWLAINPRTSQRTLRVAILWTTIYIFFLFSLRIFDIFHLATLSQLKIVSGFTSLIPLFAVIIQLFLEKRLRKKVGLTNT